MQGRQKCANSVRKRGSGYRPQVERIEERLLPGDTLGRLLLFPLALAIDPFATALAGRAEEPSSGTSSQRNLIRISDSATDAADSSLLAMSSPSPSATFSRDQQMFSRDSQRSAQDVSAAPDLLTTLAFAQLGKRHDQARFNAPLKHGNQTSPSPVAAVGLSQRPAGPNDPPAPAWNSYAHDAQHTALSDVASLSLNNGIRWQTPVDLHPPGFLGIHYGSPVITPNNTVIVPVKTAQGSNYGWQVEAHSGADGHLMWTQTTSYTPPNSSGWVPSFPVVLTSSGRLYYPGPGGTVYYCDNPDDEGATVTGQLAFYGIDNYRQNPNAYNSAVKTTTELTVDRAGTLYSGFQTIGAAPLGLRSGISRMDMTGVGTWIAARDVNPNVTQPHMTSAPALSNDESTLYAALVGSNGGYFVDLDTATLAPRATAPLRDPRGSFARISDSSTSSPMVGPDGDVYYGVLEEPFNHNDRGWLLHFNSDLSQVKIPGSFGWDNTPSLVPASLVPDYTGPSSYLLMTKYNNYADIGTGDGRNKIAVLDPNVPMPDPVLNQVTVMNEVKTILGVTPDPVLPRVREWCINTAAVDPFTGSILANSEDGTLYRWDLASNTFTESIGLAPPTSEAYTPTLIGPDGAVYAINDAVLFAVG